MLYRRDVDVICVIYSMRECVCATPVGSAYIELDGASTYISIRWS